MTHFNSPSSSPASLFDFPLVSSSHPFLFSYSLRHPNTPPTAPHSSSSSPQPALPQNSLTPMFFALIFFLYVAGGNKNVFAWRPM
ncbi:hypothetical protein E2C01_067710 [Portunus trituberculatus]|uniref:Uncharacterized protein n=1 Tax=Portunus trituberculatus TaxID=210409 RepID=A0A5B7HTL4_PORTR|nr:hypothetical protein [Portunus trituberculatus]